MSKKLTKLPLHIKIILGILIGFIYAFFAISLGGHVFTKNWIAPWGSIFINLLKLSAIPLVFFSIIQGVISLGDPKKIGKLGLKTILLFMSTTTFSVTIGLILANVISPGELLTQEKKISNRLKYEKWANENNIKVQDGKCYACTETDILIQEDSQEHKLNKGIQEKVKKTIAIAENQNELSPLQFLVDMVPSNLFQSLSNNSKMLQIIFFAIFFGLSIMFLKEKEQKPLVDFVNSMDKTFLKMINIVMKAAPYFVFCLVASEFTKLADSITEMFQVLAGLSTFALTVILGLGIMAFGVYFIYLKVFTKKVKAKKFYSSISAAQALGFSTSSSAATLPVTMECCEKNLDIKPRVSSFVLPIGATINMDGSSLYIAVSVIFLAQVHLVDLTIMDQIVILLSSVLASIGTAAVPSASLVMMMVVLQTVNLNPIWIAIILPFDRILDMCRTVVNITGDVTVCKIIDGMDKD